MERLYFETILVVMKTGSFSKAASLLCVTQSAVSHRVKFLEERLGCQLIDRSGPELVPTKAGVCVIRKAEQILQLENELKNEISRLDKKVQLSIATTATFASVYLPKVMSSFFMNQTERADLKIVVKTPAEIRNGLLLNDYDLAIIEHLEDLSLPDFVVVALPGDELVFASARRPDENLKDASLCSLAGQRLFIRAEGCSCHQLLKKNLQEIGLDIDTFTSITVVDDLALMIDAVKSGKGVAYLSRSLVRDHIEHGDLFDYHLAGFKKNRSRSLIFKQATADQDVFRFFIESILAQFHMTLTQDTKLEGRNAGLAVAASAGVGK
jgi:DNA-binding transcriptional LysR family regulator